MQSVANLESVYISSTAKILIYMNKFLHPNGDPHNLTAYKISVMIYVITEHFISRFVNSRSRNIDQMQQAARSCKQNIVEGNAAATTSKETEIKLTNVARASLSGLEEDYLDYLVFNNLPKWGFDHPRLLKMRQFVKTRELEENYRALLPKLNAEELCNLAITLIKQTQYLLDRLMQRQQERFLREGGIREQMYRARSEFRNNQRYQGNRNYQGYQNNQSYQNNQGYRNNQNNQGYR